MTNDAIPVLADELAELKAQRDELLALATAIAGYFEETDAPLGIRARAVLARCNTAPVKYGCHCDIEDTICGLPDDCVFDNGDINDCIYAVALQKEKKGKLQCQYWQPVKVKP